MVAWQRYLQPQTLNEALHDLQSAAESVKVIAGGTDLLLDIQQGRQPRVHTLLDVTSIPEMREIRVGESDIFVGAAVTHFEILQHPALNHHAKSLIEASGLIGGPQVRNVATIGGNVAHALPAGDGTIALMALGAQVEIAGPDGRRCIPLEELFTGPGQTILDQRCELLTGFYLPPLQPGEASAFYRTMRPQGVAIAILNLGVWLRSSVDGLIEDIRLAVGPAGPKPVRARRTETFLRGRLPTEDTIDAAGRELVAEVQLRASPHRATKEYRRHLVPVLLRRVLETAHDRAMVN